MSEFQEKLQMMKDSMIEIQDNPALMSTEDNGGDQQYEQSEESQQPSRRGTRKRNNNLKGRLDAVLADNKAKDANQQHLLSLLQEQEVRLAEAQARADQNANYSNAYYEKSLENEESRIITELKLAKENLDIEKEVDLQQKLSEIAAQKQTQALSKTLKKQQQFQAPPTNYAQPNYYPEQYDIPQEAPVNEHFEDWLEEHPWADPNSPEFDQDLRAEVDELATTFNKHLKFKRASHIIGSPEYFRTLSNEMDRRYGAESNSNNNEYDEYYEEPPQHEHEQSSVDNRTYAVAPVTKRGSSMADRYINNRVPNQRGQVGQGRITLTRDEWETGAKIAPMLSKIHGRRVSEEEAVAEYHKHKMNLPPEERVRPGDQLYKTYRNY